MRCRHYYIDMLRKREEREGRRERKTDRQTDRQKDGWASRQKQQYRKREE